ncbi:glutathione S-transferase family protein [Roseomonas marmotae]|uniref:Glutathione S-transferase family protein n=1 Tax=Roseomonas marmotae TaxID=2768161 RepID=A0ABS3KGR2_9PROT|nr:glutathione S-transferase family protein [Roseomonas marmotae]MBO1076660.1 glutathione S-transferase family protein [Roseomonas marmotae]QTI79603.1 glutathione S-transferase family protein [Roseomonas marmotae]
MDRYILYGDLRSGSATAEMALAEIGAPVDLREVPLEGDHQLAEDYRRINPMGRVPTLVLPDGTVVTESLAILLTLADRHPEAGLLPPPGDSTRARALRWMTLAAGEFYPHVTRSDYPQRFSADPAHAPAIRERARQMGREIWLMVEREAAPDPFILGDRFSLADIYLSVLTRWLGGDEWTPLHCPRLDRLAQAVAARPGAGPVWRKHFSGGSISP